MDKAAVGYDHQSSLSKHESQTDYSAGFGGKFGVQSDRKDKSALGWNEPQKETGNRSSKPEMPDRTRAKDLKSRFEGLAMKQSDEAAQLREQARKSRQAADNAQKAEQERQNKVRAEQEARNRVVVEATPVRQPSPPRQPSPQPVANITAPPTPIVSNYL